MNLGAILSLLETRGAQFNALPYSLIQKLRSIDLVDPEVLISCLHDPDQFLIYRAGEPPALIESLPAARHSAAARDGLREIGVNLNALDELKAIRPSLVVFHYTDSLADDVSDAAIAELISDYVQRMVHRQKSILRRSILEARVGSDDLGTFCHRLLTESLVATLDVQLASIFVLDKKNGELRLRAQTPKRTDKRHLADIAVGANSGSWVWRAFAQRHPLAEYGTSGDLRRGQTVEDPAAPYYARCYWPLRLQFRSRNQSHQRARDPVLGVIRLSNPRALDGSVRPFHCLDAFEAEFAAESIYTMVAPFVERDVEGFDRDLAFHAAKTPASGCLRNIKLAAQLLFEPSEIAFLEERDGAVPPQFQVVESGRFTRDELVRSFNNAYAFALDIASQVERANITEELYPTTKRQVDRLFADVIQKAINLAPYFEVSHSTTRHWDGSPRVSVNRLFDLALPPPIIGDEGALVSVFKNLFENSVKYSKRGEPAKIVISSDDEGDMHCIGIRDFGIGIPAEDAERIFTRGVRSERAKQHSVKGSGLGLAYCSRVVRAYGGSIKAVPLEEGLRIEVRLRKAATSGQ